LGFTLPFVFYHRLLKDNLKKAEAQEEKQEYERKKRLAILSGRSFKKDGRFEEDT